MKLPALLAILTFLPLLFVQAAPPALPIDQALKLAMDHLAERNLTDQHYIGSLTLEDSAIRGGERYWVARWEPSIRGDQTNESGLKIKMDGSLARIMSGGPAAARQDAPGQRRVGARSMR